MFRVFVETISDAYVCCPRHSPTQADATCFKAIDSIPDASLYPHAARWYKHIASYETEFADLPGDVAKPIEAYGSGGNNPSLQTAPNAGNEEGDEEIDLFDSEEEEDPEAARIREQRLADYKKRKAAKPKTIAKSVVTLDVKPWGK